MISNDILNAVKTASETLRDAVANVTQARAILRDPTSTPQARQAANEARKAGIEASRKARETIASLTQQACEGLNNKEAAAARAEISDVQNAIARDSLLFF